MAHPLEAILREAYAAFGRGDVDGYLQPCAAEFIFSVPGTSALSGDYHGRKGLYDLAARAMTITAGKFQEVVEDVLANDHHAVVLARHSFTREGAAYEYRTAHVYDVQDGKLARCYEQPRDPVAFENAWGVAGPTGLQQGV